MTRRGYTKTIARAAAGAVLTIFFAAAPFAAGQPVEIVLDPETYVSPSGEFALTVKPTERAGAGPADYELKRNGTVVWSGRRSFTFCNAVVDDHGRAGGYAYNNGNRIVSEGDLTVAFLDPRER